MVITRQSIRWLLALCALLLLTHTSNARVFLGEQDSLVDQAATDAGFKSLYSTQYKINGTDAVLHVYGAEVPLNVAVERLTSALRTHEPNVAIPVTETGAVGVVLNGDELIRMMLIPVGAGKTMICAVRQSLEAAANLKATTNGSAMPEASLPNITSFPGSRLVYHVEDQKTKTTLAVYRASGTSDLVRDFYGRNLPQNGWQSLSGVMYRRGSSNCIISVRPSQQPGEVTITLLLRRSAL